MPKCYQLIGVPGAGKSTWYSNQDWMKDMAYVSTDMFVEEHAKSVGKTYSEVFNDFMPTAVDLMVEEVIKAREVGKDIIWDQTSTTLASRTRKFNMLPDYYHIAVVFKTPEHKELMRRLKSRPGKVIPKRVIQQMTTHWEDPSEEEGFKEIWYT